MRLPRLRSLPPARDVARTSRTFLRPTNMAFATLQQASPSRPQPPVSLQLAPVSPSGFVQRTHSSHVRRPGHVVLSPRCVIDLRARVCVGIAVLVRDGPADAPPVQAECAVALATPAPARHTGLLLRFKHTYAPSTTSTGRGRNAPSKRHTSDAQRTCMRQDFPAAVRRVL